MASVEMLSWETKSVVNSILQSYTRTAGMSPKYLLLISKLFIFSILNRSYISSNKTSVYGTGSARLEKDFSF